MEENQSYLSKLKFDPKLNNSWVAKFLSNPRLLFLIILSVLVAGSFSFANLPRRLNPEVKIPIVIVSTPLPGAGPNDIESLVTIPLEDQISQLSNISKLSSQSRDSVSIITAEFESGIDPDKARSDVQAAVDGVSLPEDAIDPNVTDIDFENQPVLTATIISRDNEAGLVRFSDRLKNKLEDNNLIREVNVSGIDTQEIQVVIKPTSLSSFGVNPLQVSSIIKSALSSYPAGSVNTESLSYSLTIDPEVQNIDDIRNLLININGNIVPISSVADVSLKSKPEQRSSFYATNEVEPNRSVSMSIYKTKSANISESADAANKIIENEIKDYKDIYIVRTVTDSSEEISDQFHDLYRDFSIIIILVFVALFIFLGARQAVIASLSVPFTFLISFVLMSITGMTLNFLTLFSLLLSLGLLVDDTIVVISAMTSYYRTKRFTPHQTGLLVWKDFLTPIFTTTITTVWAFIPLLLSTGIIGEFIVPIPIVVSGTLLASFFVAMFINLPLVVLILKPNIPYRVAILLKLLMGLLIIGLLLAFVPGVPFKILTFVASLILIFILITGLSSIMQRSEKFLNTNKNTKSIVKKFPSYIDNGIVHFDVIANRYKKLILHILRSSSARKTTILMVIVFSIFSYLLVPFGFVKNEFFPATDSGIVYVSVELPSGTNLSTTEIDTIELMDLIRDTKGVEFLTANVGQGYDATGGISNTETNNFLITLSLLPDNQRSLSSQDISDLLREKLSGYQKGKLSVFEPSGGPPAGSDIQIQISGDDLTQLSEYADNLIVYLEKTKGTANVNKTIKEGTSKIVFTPNSDQLAANGITQDQIGLNLRLFASGFTTDTVTFVNSDDSKTDITIRLSDGIQNVESIGAISIPSPTGSLVSINQLGTLNVASNPTLITREDGQRTISVTASVLPGYNNTDINRGLEEYATKELNLSSGYSWKTGGVNEENQKSVTSILQAMILSFLLIIITMVLQFSSFRKAIIVMLVIPLSISGVFILFALTKTPLSFPALIGVLALFGIVVKNSILVVDKISANEKSGMPFIEGIADASSSRLEAIALTSVTAILGLIPITLSDPLWRGLGGAIIAGLTFSGTIMLFFIPVVYYYWFRPSRKNKNNN